MAGCTVPPAGKDGEPISCKASRYVGCAFRRVAFGAASVSDHIVPHNKNLEAFWAGATQSLCRDCHGGTKAAREQSGFSREILPSGFPADPNHPFYLGYQPTPTRPTAKRKGKENVISSKSGRLRRYRDK